MDPVTVVTLIVCAVGTFALLAAISKSRRNRPTVAEVLAPASTSAAPSEAGLADQLAHLDSAIKAEAEAKRHRDAALALHSFAYAQPNPQANSPKE